MKTVQPARDFIPISEMFPGQKPFMDENGKRRQIHSTDLRVHTLKQVAAKRQCTGPQQHLAGAPGTENSAGPFGFGTDFSAFNQHIRQEQQLSSTSSRAAAQLEERLGPKVERLSSQHQLQGLLSLEQAFPASQSRDGFSRHSMPAPLPPAGGSNPADSTAAAAAAPGNKSQLDASGWHLVGLPNPPWDWSLKTRVKIASEEPLMSISEAAEGQHVTQACQVASLGVSCEVLQAATAQEKLQHALMQWQHPAEQLSKAAIAAMHAARPCRHLLAARVQQWRDAVRGLYGSLRHGHCPVVYLANCMAYQQPFSVILCAPGLMGCPEISALVTRSNRQLRQLLAATGATFAQQAVAAAAVGGAGKSAGGVSNDASAMAAAVAAHDGRPGSQLLVRGLRSVHALYLALLQLPWCNGPDAADVPLVLAPVPFTWGTLVPLMLQVLPNQGTGSTRQAQRPGTAAAAAGGVSTAPLHYVECVGSYITPWALNRMCSVLAEEQDWDMFLTTEPTTTTVNIKPGAWEEQAAGVRVQQEWHELMSGTGSLSEAAWRRAPGKGLLKQEEWDWQHSATQLEGRLVTKLGCRDKRLVAKLGE